MVGAVGRAAAALDTSTANHPTQFVLTGLTVNSPTVSRCRRWNALVAVTARRHNSLMHTQRSVGALTLMSAALTLIGCSDGPPIVLRTQAVTSTPSSSTGDASDASECADLHAQIRAYSEQRREAPATSTSNVIVQAQQGKDDKHIDDLQQQLDDLNCPAETGGPGRTAPLPPAPGGPTPNSTAP